MSALPYDPSNLVAEATTAAKQAERDYEQLVEDERAAARESERECAAVEAIWQEAKDAHERAEERLQQASRLYNEQTLLADRADRAGDWRGAAELRQAARTAVADAEAELALAKADETDAARAACELFVVAGSAVGDIAGAALRIVSDRVAMPDGTTRSVFEATRRREEAQVHKLSAERLVTTLHDYKLVQLGERVEQAQRQLDDVVATGGNARGVLMMLATALAGEEGPADELVAGARTALNSIDALKHDVRRIGSAAAGVYWQLRECRAALERAGHDEVARQLDTEIDRVERRRVAAATLLRELGSLVREGARVVQQALAEADERARASDDPLLEDDAALDDGDSDDGSAGLDCSECGEPLMAGDEDDEDDFAYYCPYHGACDKDGVPLRGGDALLADTDSFDEQAPS